MLTKSMLRENDVLWDLKMVTLVTNRPLMTLMEKGGFLTRTYTRNRIFNRHFQEIMVQSTVRDVKVSLMLQ
jgi:hypothetical protein